MTTQFFRKYEKDIEKITSDAKENQSAKELNCNCMQGTCGPEFMCGPDNDEVSTPKNKM